MKKLLLALMGIALTTLISQTSYSQYVAANNAKQPAKEKYNAFTGTENPDGIKTKLAISNVNVTAKFSKMFDNAENQQWITLDDYHHVSFTNNDRKARAVFTSKGTMNYLIKDISLAQSPVSFRMKISRDFPGFSLLQALEITANNTVSYQAILENDQRFITLTSNQDGIDEVKEQKKTK